MPVSTKSAKSAKPRAAGDTTASPKKTVKKTTAPAKPNTSAKKATPARKPTLPAVTVATPVPTPKKVAAPRKAVQQAKTASVSVTRTTNPRTNSVTIKKITRNIVGFYMTEDIEIRRATRSDNMSSEKLKAKYAELKNKVKLR